VITVKNAVLLDYETTASYALTVQATDPLGLSATNTLTVSVLDVNEAPTISNSNRSIAENSLVGSLIGVPVVVSDPDANEVFSWTVLSGGGGVIVISAGQLSTNGSINFESVSSYTVQVRVTDKGG